VGDHDVRRDLRGRARAAAPVAELLRFDPSWITYRLTSWIDDIARSPEIDRDRLRPVLVEDPAAAERLSDTLARHRAGQAEALERAAGSRPAAATGQPSLLSSIRRVFGLADQNGA
jgi:hypothetical protein